MRTVENRHFVDKL